MFKKALAVVATAALSLGLATVPALSAQAGSHGDGQDDVGQDVCNDFGYTTIDLAVGDTDVHDGDENVAAHLTWGESTLYYDVTDGYTIDICIKGGEGTGDPDTPKITQRLELSGTDSISLTDSDGKSKDISHIGYIVHAPVDQCPAMNGLQISATECEQQEEDTSVHVSATETGERCDPQNGGQNGGTVLAGQIVLTVLVDDAPVSLPSAEVTVSYLKQGDVGPPTQVTDNTITGLTDGVYDFTVSVAAGHTLISTSPFRVTIDDQPDDGCDEPDVPVTVTPESSAETCVAGGSIQLTVAPNAAGIEKIEYRVKNSGDAWTPVNLATLLISPLDPETYEFLVTLKTGYTMTSPEFEATVGEADDGLCGDLTTSPTVEASVSSTPLTCEAAGSYTLSDDALFTAEHPAPAVFWTVNGNPVVAGTFPVTSAGTVIVQVAVNGPAWAFTEGQQTEWELVFTDPVACDDLETLALPGDLETLALTGVGDAMPALALAGFLGLLGAALARSSIRLGRQQG